MERRNGDPTTVIVTCNPNGMALGRNQGPYDRPARPKRRIGLGWPRLAEAGRGWPRLAEARGSLEHDLALNTKEVSGEPAGRGLSHLVLHTSRRQGRAQGDAVLHPARGEDVLPVLRHHVPGPLDTESGKTHILARQSSPARGAELPATVAPLSSSVVYIEVRFAHNLIVAADEFGDQIT